MFAKSNTQAELPQDFWNCILIKLTLSFNSINFYTWSIGRGGRMLQKRANYMFLSFVSLRGLVKIIWNLKLENEVNDKHVLFSKCVWLKTVDVTFLPAFPAIWKIVRQLSPATAVTTVTTTNCISQSGMPTKQEKTDHLWVSG